MKKETNFAHNEHTNYTILRELYGQTEIWIDGQQACTMKKYLKHLRSNIESTFTIRVHRNRHTNAWKKRTIETIEHHRHGQKQALKRCTFPMLHDLYCAVDAYIHSQPARRRVRKIIDSYMTVGWTEKKYNRPKSFNVRYLYDHRIDEQKLRRKAEEIVEKSKIGEETKRMILLKLRVIAKRRKTIKEQLVNNKKFTRTWSKQHGPRCIGKQWCKEGIHYQSKLEDIGGLATKIGNMNSNIILRPLKEKIRNNTRQALIEFANNIRKILGKRKMTGNKQQVLKGILRSIGINKKDRGKFVMKLREDLREWQNDETNDIPGQLELTDKS